MFRRAGSALVAAAIAACAAGTPAPPPTMNDIAERYVKLALAVGEHDGDFVDAYYGDPSWKPAGGKRPLAEVLTDARSTRVDLHHLTPPADADAMVRLRFVFLDRQLAAVEARLEMLSGTKFLFDEETQRLYDAEAPRTSKAELTEVLDGLDRLLPGRGALADRYAMLRNDYVIPREKLDVVFRAAIDGCRRRTLEHLALPAGERFTVEYVTGKTWSAYNWYKGNFTSVIQVNTDLPITIDRALDLACHEGYPGHHVYNVLLEQHLVRGRGWKEFSIYPLFSPQSLIAEGTANFGVDVAFPGEARTAFERDTLYPLAGLKPGTAAAYAAVMREVDRLSYAGNEAARRYLNGEIDRDAAVAWLVQFAMMPRDRALQRTKFFDQYRSYVINYNHGKDLVRAYIDRQGGTADRPEVRWAEFGKLLASPRLPSGLR